MINHTVLGAHSGQTDERLYTTDESGKTTARLDYSVYQGEPHVQMIKSNVPRQGLARALLVHLQSLYPDTEIDLGMLTDDGAALVRSLKYQTIVDPVLSKKNDLLARVKEKIANLEANISPENVRQHTELWNRLYDMERRLEDELEHAQLSKKIIVG